MPAHVGGTQLAHIEAWPAANDRFELMHGRHDDRRGRRISRRGYFDLLSADVDARDYSAVVRDFRRRMLFIRKGVALCMAAAMRNRRAMLTIAAGNTCPMLMPTTAHQNMEGEGGDGDDSGEVHVDKRSIELCASFSGAVSKSQC